MPRSVDLDGDAVVGAVAPSSAARTEVARATLERMSIVARASPGTVFIGVAGATVVITDVISGRPSVSASMRRISRASALTALRPRCGVGPRVSRAAVQRERPPDRALALRHQVAVLAGALEDERGGGSLRLGAHGRCAQPRLLVGAHQQAHLRERTAGAAASRSIATAASSTPPFMSATPGPKQRSPSRRNGRSAAVPTREHGVGVAQERDHRAAVARQGHDHAARRAVRLGHPPARAAGRRQPLGHPLARPTPARSRPTASRGSRAARAWRRSARRPQKP